MVKRFVVPEDAAGQRLDRYLAGQYEASSRSQIGRWISAGAVQVDDRVPKASLLVRTGQHIAVEVPEPPSTTLIPEKIPLCVLYEDEHLVVVDKRAGLVVHPGAGHPSGTLVNGLIERYGVLSPIGGPFRPGIVHRLDAGTSGVIVVARTEIAHHRLAQMFAERRIERRYWAVAWDHDLPDDGVIDTLYGRHPHDRRKFTGRVARGKRAVTRFRVSERVPPCAVVELRLETGRTHQIRVHLAEAGHPLVGDATYGRRRKIDRPACLRNLGFELGMARQALHAGCLAFEHPVEGGRLRFDSPLPEDLSGVVAALHEAQPRPTGGTQCG